MRIIQLPTRLFESGDLVLTPEGQGTVVQDFLDDVLKQDLSLEELADVSGHLCTVHIRLDKPTSKYPDKEVSLRRELLLL